MYEKLSLQQTPPFSVPVRFFVSAPLFGIAAGLIVLFYGPELFLSRWTPGMLAVTHALVLGFFATIMLGALQQILPVVAGVNIQRPELTSVIIHLLWVPGVLLLISAFLSSLPRLFFTATVILGAAVIITFIAVFFSLRDSRSVGDSVPGIKLALTSLFITFILGTLLSLGHAGVLPLLRPVVTDLHMSWGLFGWIAVLIMAVAWQVVPMFQITPAYPRWLKRYMAPVMLTLLAGQTLLALAGINRDYPGIGLLLNMLLGAGLIIFAITTLSLQQAARRKITDSHRMFWRMAMISLMFAVVCWVVAEISGQATLHLLAAAVFLGGFVMAVISGMLLKIIAFLVWLHLQKIREQRLKAGGSIFSVPKMGAVISMRQGNRLLYLLILAVAAISAACVLPKWFTHAAALIWLIYFSLLLELIVQSIISYRSVKEIALKF